MGEAVSDSTPVETLAICAASKHLYRSPSFQRDVFISWIKENICKKKCCFFQTDPRTEFCKCGYSKDAHTDEAIKPKDFTGQAWDKHRHVQEVQTDAFGDIDFGGLGQKIGKYARVSADTKDETLYHLLTEQWKLSPPNLLISVTGGAKNFYMKAGLKNMFHRGLIKVAQTTGAWIITGGTHAGVMKHVGQAVRDHALSSTEQGKIVAIGVATWGVIHNRDKLVHKEGCFPAHYTMDTEGQGRLSCLDNNHTHFLLVDDGTNGRFGVEIELRTLLEKYISSKTLGNKVSGGKIPVVCVVLDGGPGTLNTIYNAMLNGTPCVILEGSGRMADVIAQASGKPIHLVTIALIQQLMKKFFGEEYDNFKDLRILEWTKKIQDIIRMSHLLTIFTVSEDSHADVDVAILQALLKASRSDETQGMCWTRQLELAIAWNRVDIAKTEIFTEESQWKSRDLHGAFSSALVGNKPRFVSLLLENGVNLRDFLQDDKTLCELYEQLPSCFFLRKLAKRVHGAKRSRRHMLCRRVRSRTGGRERVSLTHVSEEVRRLLGKFTVPIYPPAPVLHDHSISTDDTAITVSKLQADSPAPLMPDSAEAHRDPGTDLFLWAVVQNNKELSEIAWEQCRDCMSAALAASKILKTMAKEESETDESQEMLALASDYETWAIGVFGQCHNSDEGRAQRLLVRVSRSWGGTTCLRLALEADDKNFVALSGVQALLTQIWCGKLSVDNPVWRVLICIVFFPLIYTSFLVFRRDELIQREAEKKEEMKTLETVTGSRHGTNSRSSLQSHEEPLGCWSRLMGLYGAPQVKFYLNIGSYFAFLFLFAVVLMIDFQPIPSTGELLLYVWLLSLVFEEIRQLFYDPDGFGFEKKAKMYIRDLWNILDVLSIILFIIGLGFRLTDVLFYAGKVILCIDFVVFCLRLMAIFTISRTLGPKIIIVRRMMMDMFFFMFLLSIWVVAYGVAKQGILIHNEDRLDWIFRGAVYEPYLIIFGNFPQDIEYAQFDVNSCSVNGTDPLKPKCPMLNDNQTPAFPVWLTVVMLCVYLLFANILLLNLLIAIFNFTFQEVQDNTDRIWKFQRYELIKEYHSRPAAPPPFIILNHVCLFMRGMVLCKPPIIYSEFRNKLGQREEEELLSWEALMKDRYLQSVQQKKSQSTDRRILDTAQKVSSISERLEREEESSSAAVLKRLARLEEQVVQSTKVLQWIMDSLKSQGVGAKEAQSLPADATDQAPDSPRNTKESKDGYHVKSRQFSYPNSKLTRFPVPDEKVPWKVSFSSYMPTSYAPENDADHVDGSEPEALEKYRNPRGRTGMKGRGALNHLGPNLYLDLVVTRWQDSKGSVLEFLAVLDDKQKSFVLPGGPVESADHLPATLKTTLGKKLYETIKAKVSEGTKVFEGYVDDERNTDNAWVETTVLNIHLDIASQVTVDIDHMVVSSYDLHWEEVSRKTILSPGQRDSLQLVAALHNRKF